MGKLVKNRTTPSVRLLRHVRESIPSPANSSTPH